MPHFLSPHGGPAFKPTPAISRRSVFALLASPTADQAGQLDRRADAELAAGHHLQAERLSNKAALLRGWA